MGMGLQERGAGPHDFPPLAPRVARGTDRLQPPLWRGQIQPLRQSTLACGLPGAVQIEDHPSLPSPVPQTSHPLGGSRASQRVLQEHATQRFHTRLVQGRKKATERRAMRQLAASEQGHERRRKRLQTLVIRGPRWLTTDGIAHQHDHKVNHFEGAEAFAGEANLLGDFGKDTLTCQGVGNQGHFLEYIILPLSLIVLFVEAILVNACVILRRNNFDPLLIFSPRMTTYRVLRSVCSATRANQRCAPHLRKVRLHLDILWWTAGAETSEREVYRRAFHARSSRLPSLPQASR